jgi:hypothetical protein
MENLNGTIRQISFRFAIYIYETLSIFYFGLFDTINILYLYVYNWKQNK